MATLRMLEALFFIDWRISRSFIIVSFSSFWVSILYSEVTPSLLQVQSKNPLNGSENNAYLLTLPRMESFPPT